MSDFIYFSHLAPRFPAASCVGQTESWVAPFAKFSSEDGFGEELWVPASPETVLALRLSGADVTSEVGRTRRSAPDRNLAFQPAGLPNHYWCAGPTSFVQIYLPDALLDRASRAVDAPPLSGRLRDDLVFVADPELERRTRAAARAAFASAPNALEVEAYVLLLLARLLDLHGDGGKRISKGGLAPRHLRRVSEYLVDHLAADVRLTDLAALTGLSTFHLCRAFKESTGLPPHRWRLQRRVERARELLERTDLPIGDVAAQVGYDDPSQLAAVFRKVLGVTPTQCRRERRW